MTFRKKILSLSVALLGALFFAGQAKAISFTPPPFNNSSYQAAYVSQSISDPITIEAGSSKEVTIKMKNTGSATWSAIGSNYASVYTVNPSYRESIFAGSSWLSKSHPVKISATTKPGEVAEIKIKLTAPSKTGDYTEDFYLAAENLTWIKSGYFYLKIKVVEKTATQTMASQSSGYTFTRDLELGMSGADVKELQKFLNNNGFSVAVSGVGSKGNETTMFGSLTKSALAKFQTANKISPAVGYLGPLTRAAVNKLNTVSTVLSNTTNDNTSGSSDDAGGNSTEGVDDTAGEVSKEYRANLLAFSARSITAKGGDLVNFKVRYINDGAITWNNYLWQEAGSSIKGEANLAEVSTVVLADASWVNEKKILSNNVNVANGEVAEFTFNFRAPKNKGLYIARFQLTANGHTLDGGTLELPVTVTANAPVGYQEPVFNNVSNRVLTVEPNIRVGLYKSDDPVQFASPFVYQIWSGIILKGNLPANEVASIKYYDGLYTFNSQSFNFNSREKIRLTPIDQSAYFTIPSYSRLVGWKGDKNFNVYRNTFEYIYSNKSEMPWVVNELLLDQYVAGIGETSNGAAMEYIKAILTAARTYAYYHINNGVPADQRTYDVVATTADQLYLGYNSEVLMPRVVQAARATYGEMVTYQSTPVVTPYYGHSDGRTRTWVEVWGGTDKPWLQSVSCKYDVGQSLWGHGVGMSAADAAQRADKDGWTYDQLLKYYYTNTEVERIY